MTEELTKAARDALEALDSLLDVAMVPMTCEGLCSADSAERWDDFSARRDALRAALQDKAVEVVKCVMMHAPAWKSSVGGLPYLESNFACKACGYAGIHDTHPGCKKTTQPAAQATPEPKPFAAPGRWFPVDVLGNPMREFEPGKWEAASWPSAAAPTPTPQQAAGEPVGELVAALPDGISFHVRWLAHSGPALKVGDRIYTHPAPGVPEGFALVPVEPDEMWAYRVIRQHQPHLEVGCKAWLKELETMLHWHAAMLAAAQANGADHG